jgi:hypothetical protein
MNDVGKRALDQIYTQMMIDAEWSVRSERSFTWWPKDFAQTVSVSPPVESRGLQICRLTASTPLVQGLSTESRVLNIIDAINRSEGGLSALVLDRTGTLSYVSAVVVHEQMLEFVSKIFAMTAAMQATDAEIRAPLLAEVLRGQATATCHPSSGTRPGYDDLVNVIEQLVVPWGEQPSRWIGQPMLDALEVMKRLSLMAMGDEESIAVEFPWADATCLLELNPAFAHSRLGSCLHVTLTLPDKASEEEMLLLTRTLNCIEALPETLTDFQGTWCISPSKAVTFSAIYPNYLFRPGLGTNIALGMGARAEWLVNLLDSQSREQRWHNARPAAFVVMGVDSNFSRAGRDADLINKMAQHEGRPAFGEPGTLTPAEVHERLEGAFNHTLRKIAGKPYRPGAAYSRLWEGSRRLQDGFRTH